MYIDGKVWIGNNDQGERISIIPKMVNRPSRSCCRCNRHRQDGYAQSHGGNIQRYGYPCIYGGCQR